MCNEFAQERAWKAYCEMMAAEALNIVTEEPPELPFGSVHPSERAAIISATHGGSQLDLLYWGVRRRDGPGLVLNYRAEGRRDPPSARGLAIFDRFYEYAPGKAPKPKFAFSPAGNEPMALATLRHGDRFVLLTVEPGPEVAQVHSRQPLVIVASNWGAWLRDPAWNLAQPSPAGTLRTQQVR